MTDIFAQLSLCYLTNRCDEGFQLLDSFLNKSSSEICLHWEEQEVVCLISINVISRRYQSWKHLNRLLTQTDDLQKRQSIENYIQIILNEMNSYSNEVLILIENYLFKSFLSSDVKSFYWKIQGDIHFLLSQTSKMDNKLEHFLSSLHFYNQALQICSHDLILFSTIIYNKALLFILITEEYDLARDLLEKTISDLEKKQIENDKLQSLLNYLNKI